MLYKYLTKFGIKIYTKPIRHIKWKELNKVLKKEKIMDKFSKYFGCQTYYVDGPYPYDVEAVFVRIFDKKLTGTQLFWD